MAIKEKFELEYTFKTSSKVLDKLLTTPEGLTEWFADEVLVDGDIYNFHWDGSEEQARLIQKKAGEGIKLQWVNDEDEGNDTFFEMKYSIDPTTKVAVLTISDFADKSEHDQSKRLWESQVMDLRRKIGTM